ncbi:MAG: hypothetical protein ACLSIL_10070 [Enterococcus casseliflavus]
MNKGEGWQWQKFLKTIIELNGKITRIDLALDIFDDLSPSVKTIFKTILNEDSYQPKLMNLLR